MAIKEKPNSKYLVDVRDEFGKRIQRTFRTKSEAKVFEASITKTKYDVKLTNNGLKEPRYFFSQAVEDYRATKTELRPKSFQKYNFVCEQLLLFTKAVGVEYLDEFTPEIATLLYNALVEEKEDPKKKDGKKRKAKPKTINFFLTATRALFTREMEKGHINRSPMIHIKNLKVQKRRPDYYHVEELKSFFAQEMSDAYRAAFMGLLFTGMRFAELANLTWEDVDLGKLLLHVKSKEGFVTKTHNSERVIPMNNILYQLILKLYEERNSQKYVFAAPRGGQLKERRMLQVCKRVARDASIKSNAYLHKFRHTYATMLIQNGVPIQNIKELLGHWSVIETEIYAHNKSDHLHPDVSKLNNLLN